MILYFFVITFLIIFLISKFLIRSRLPPGPLGFPFLGCIPYIRSKTAHLTVERWCRRYGNLLSFYMGDTLVVVLGDCNIIREAFLKNGCVFNGRSVIRAFRSGGIAQGMGLTGAEGDLWRDQRRFCMKMLKDFGAGRSILEPKLRREAEFLCQKISQTQARPFDISSLLHYAVANIIVEFTFGRRFDYEDPIYIDYLSTITYRLSKSGVNGFSAFNFLPFLLKLPFQNREAKKVIRDGQRVLEFLQRLIDQKRSEFEKSNLDQAKLYTDYVSEFLKMQSSGENQYFTNDQLLIAVQQLFIAGSETTATTLRWAIWYLCQYPHCQEKIYEEIKINTIDQYLSWSDRSKTPYTEATICEIERMRTIFPFSVTHRTLKETYLNGYYIPENAYVIPLVWAIHRDPKYFHEPNRFMPERFLDSNGQLMKNPSFMPFGIGLRACLGESLAKMELYIFLTTLLQKFRFHFPTKAYPKEEHVVGVVISPAPFYVIAEERQ